MGAEGGDGLGLGVGELDEFAGEGEFGGGFQRGGGGLGGGVAGAGVEFAEDGVDARDGVEEVGGGVALEGDHFFPGEGVVAGAILGEVGVLHGAYTDDGGDGGALGFGELAGLFVHQAAGAVDGLLEQVLEFDVFAAAGFEGAAVFAEHGAEAEVFQP